MSLLQVFLGFLDKTMTGDWYTNLQYGLGAVVAISLVVSVAAYAGEHR